MTEAEFRAEVASEFPRHTDLINIDVMWGTHVRFGDKSIQIVWSADGQHGKYAPWSVEADVTIGRGATLKDALWQFYVKLSRRADWTCELRDAIGEMKDFSKPE